MRENMYRAKMSTFTVFDIMVFSTIQTPDNLTLLSHVPSEYQDVPRVKNLIEFLRPKQKLVLAYC